MKFETLPITLLDYIYIHTFTSRQNVIRSRELNYLVVRLRFCAGFGYRIADPALQCSATN